MSRSPVQGAAVFLARNCPARGHRLTGGPAAGGSAARRGLRGAR